MRLRSILILVISTWFSILIWSGCGSKHVVNIQYFNPTWHPNGKIICAKQISEYDVGYPETSMNEKGRAYITEITIDQNNNYVSERDLFAIDSCYRIEISVSPDGNYILYSVFKSIDQPREMRIVGYGDGVQVNNIYWEQEFDN